MVKNTPKYVVKLKRGKCKMKKCKVEGKSCSMKSKTSCRKLTNATKKQYNLRSNPDCPTYEVGENVLKRTFDLSDKAKGFCAKLAPKFELAVVRKKLGKH